MIEAPIEDRLALLDLHSRLAFAIDSGDAAGWAELFTPDGVLRTSTPRELRGREELAAFAFDWWQSSPAQRRHVTWHHRFSGGEDGRSAKGTCYAAVLRTEEGRVSAEFTAVYVDRFSRLEADGSWLLEERDVAIDRS
jgi:uncharacterized protein (TIGR02246 family)